VRVASPHRSTVAEMSIDLFVCMSLAFVFFPQCVRACASASVCVCVFLPFVDTFTIYGKCCLSPGPLPQERRQASGRSSPSNPLKVTFATHQKQKRISPKKNQAIW